MEMNIDKVLEENEALKKELHKKEQKEKYHKELLELLFEDVRVMKSNNKVFIKSILALIGDFEDNDKELETDLTQRVFNLYKANVDENANKSTFRIFQNENEIENEEMDALITTINGMLRGLDDEDETVIVTL